jgi:quinol monooxygenase YgiN
MRYGYSGKMTTRPGQRDAVAALLLRGVDGLKELGCEMYMVSVSPGHPDAVFVTEIWTSREAHRASLQLPAVKAAIAEAMPMLTGEFESVELSVLGGLGVPEPRLAS